MHFGLRIAIASLRTHRLRTLLAMIGVFLGALALTSVQHVAEAMLRKAETETAKFGTNLFVARAGQVRFSRSGRLHTGETVTTFTLADAEVLLHRLPPVEAGAPFVEATQSLRHLERKVPVQLVATVPAYTEVRSFHPQLGRFLTAADVERRARVCVLGVKVAQRLFGSAQAALGQTVLLVRAPVVVVGVMEAKGADILGSDQDEQVFVPLTSYLRRFANQSWLSGVYLQLQRPEDGEPLKATVRRLLRQRHRLDPGEKDDFTLLTGRDRMELQRQALDLVQTLGLISSSISFAVGGLGILSIMVLLVRTRRLEIGIRRAVGARRRDIIGQFMLEAVLIAGIGGAAGVAVATVLLALVYHFGDFPPVYNGLKLAGPLVGSVFLGLAAGAYPAWQAARIQVLEVLRSE